MPLSGNYWPSLHYVELYITLTPRRPRQFWHAAPHVGVCRFLRRPAATRRNESGPRETLPKSRYTPATQIVNRRGVLQHLNRLRIWGEVCHGEMNVTLRLGDRRQVRHLYLIGLIARATPENAHPVYPLQPEAFERIVGHPRVCTAAYSTSRGRVVGSPSRPVPEWRCVYRAIRG